MTTKTDITLLPLPGALVDVETEAREYARVAVEADRQNHFRDATKMVPSDDDIAAACKSLGWDLDAQEEADMILLVRTVLARPTSGQPAASAEPCFCDRMYPDSDPSQTCGDCPRDYRPAASARRAAPVAQEPVAEVLSNRKGNDTSTIDKALPAGTKLYAAPVAAQAQPTMPPLTDAMRAVLRNEHCVYDSDDALYAALCDAARAQRHEFDDCTASPTGKHSESWFANGDCEYCKAGAQPNAPLFYAQAQPTITESLKFAQDHDAGLADTQRAIIEAAERRGYERAIAECAQVARAAKGE
ncbi:hypothetical protein ACMHYO_11610 [Allopusillimonas ginsengisoli]|uniref:hypothetical protein n=1 Tax=Allopusillimonas ginsengisoli TaxID=453575 RepID=UPI0039C4DB4D